MTSVVDTDPQATRPPPSRTYLLAADEQGRPSLSVHVKRVYRLRPDGRCTRAEGEIPLLAGNDMAEDEADFNETDIIPLKQRTDLIVMAKAWGRGARHETAKIRVGGHEVCYRISGDRRVAYHGKGTW